VVVEPARAVNLEAAERQLPRVWAAEQAQPIVEAPSAFVMVELPQVAPRSAWAMAVLAEAELKQGRLSSLPCAVAPALPSVARAVEAAVVERRPRALASAEE
jgi:hypothetical protein